MTWSEMMGNPSQGIVDRQRQVRIAIYGSTVSGRSPFR